MPIINGYFYPELNSSPSPGSGIAGAGKGPIDTYVVGPSIKDSSGREGLISVFGEIQSVARTADISLTFAYSISTGSQGDLNVSGTNDGYVIQTNSMLAVTSSTNVNGYAYAQSQQIVQYHAGHEVYSYFTAQFFSGASADNLQRIGLFSSEDGYFIGMTGSTFIVGKINSGTETIVTQNNFNLNKLDSSGNDVNRFTINPYNMNIFRISVGYLGAAPCLFSVMNEDGHWLNMHLMKWTNLQQGTAVSLPHLPMRAEVNKKGSGSSNLQLKTASWTGGSLGDPKAASERHFAFENSKSGITSETNLFTLKSSGSFNGKNNKIRAHIQLVAGGIDSGAPLGTIRIRKNATLGGSPSYSFINPTNSMMLVDIAGTTISNGGALELALPVTNNNNTIVNTNEYNLYLMPNETLTFSLSSAGAALSASISARWKEYF